MSEVVEEHPSLIPVINRFGIRLGLGDKSVKAICEEYRLDTDFLLTVINTFLNEEYFPEKKLQTFHTSQIIDYLTKTNQYYQRYQIPNIERHLGSFISMSTPGNNTLNLIGKFFSSFKEELTSRIEKDDRVWFPYCLSLSEKLKDYPSSGQVEALHLGTEQRLEDPIEALLADLKSIMVKHLSGDYNENLCYAVIFAISSLEKDIKQHNRIRYRILTPMVSAMESCVFNKQPDASQQANSNHIIRHATKHRLQSMLTDYFPPVEISHYPTFEAFSTSGNDTFDYYFTNAALFVLYADFFLPRRSKTMVLIDETEGEGGLSATSHITIKASQEVIIEQLEQLFTGENNSISSDNNKELSTRETDVLQLIVKGSTNKEIADKLNISLNTVLSHRKNITTKLGIKTVSGLTFYAIMNGIISGDDIEL